MRDVKKRQEGMESLEVLLEEYRVQTTPEPAAVKNSVYPPASATAKRSHSAFDMKKLKEPIDYHLTVPKGDYKVDFNITVKPNGLMEIAPGTRFFFSQGKGIISRGKLISVGKEGEEIEFLPWFNSWKNIQILTKASSGSVLKYCTIRGGAGSSGYNCDSYFGSEVPGGGLLISHSDVTLVNCLVEENTADSGCGILIHSSKCNMVDLSVRNNHAMPNPYTYGGGILVLFSEIKMKKSMIVGNVANTGGGIEMQGTSALLEEVVITNNLATKFSNDIKDSDGGGGIYLVDSPCSLIDCRITDNYAINKGGGLHAYDCKSLYFQNTEFSENHVNVHKGSELCLEKSTAVFMGSLISFDNRYTKGEAFYCDDSSFKFIGTSLVESKPKK